MKNSVQRQVGKTWMALALMLVVWDAQAAVSSGSWYSRSDRTHVFVKSVPGELDDAYGLILKEDQAQTAALFRIEETATGAQAWVPLQLDTDRQMLQAVSDRQPSFTVQLDSRGTLKGTLTEAGKSRGAAAFEARPRKKYKWSDLPNQSLSFRKRGLTGALALDGGVMSLTFSKRTQRPGVAGIADGLYILDSALPGIATSRAQLPSSESGSGLTEGANVGFATAFIEKAPCLGLGNRRQTLLVIQIAEDAGESTSVSLKEY